MLEAGHRSSPDADVALAVLCETYWFPLYSFARRRGYASHDAMDRTQSFFERMLEKDYLQAADQKKGRFRSFLLTMFKRFLSKELDREQALKRGGNRKVLSYDVDEAEARYRLEPADQQTPEHVFERRWALVLLDRVLGNLEQDYRTRHKGDLFDACAVYLTGSTGAPSYSTVADSLGMTEGALKVAVHRLRQRYRELLKQEVAQTLGSDDDVDDELSALLSAVRAR